MFKIGTENTNSLYIADEEIYKAYIGQIVVWNKEKNFITFTSHAGSGSIGLSQISQYQTLEYRKTGDPMWYNFTTAVTVSLGHNEKCDVRGKLVNNNFNDNYTNFKIINGTISVSGNINSLWNYEDLEQPLYQYCGKRLFKQCTNLVSANKLTLGTSETILATGCYSEMFSGCVGLQTPPKMPASILANYCYASMFNLCGLLAQPELPATTLANYCYSGMFHDCFRLRIPPVLPATTLAEGCYFSMFGNCRILTTAPELPSTELKVSCYFGMFSGCVGLETAPSILPATTLTSHCYEGMFNGCTNLNYIKCLATDISASNCTNNWLFNVSATGTFVKHPNATGWATGVNGIPNNWTVEDAT